MTTYTNDQLRAWAAQAAADLAAELDLFGINDQPVITPAAVRAILRVVVAAQPPVTALMPPVAPVAVPLPAQAITITDPAPVARLADPPPPAAPNPQRRPTRAKPSLAEIYDVIRSLAVDGHMPSQFEYDAQRPQRMPTSMTVRNWAGKPWTQIAADIGLPLRPAARGPSPLPTDTRLEQVYDYLRANAADGRMLSQRVYDAQRPRHLPNSGSIVRLSGTPWHTIAARLSLKPALNPSRSAKKIEMMRTAKAQAAPPPKPEPEPEPEPEPPAPTTKPTPPVVEIAAPATKPTPPAAILGPEHVVVTPHRNGSNGAAQRAQRLDEIKAALRDMALITDGRMPKISEWNARKPAHLPAAGPLMMQYDFRDWGAVAKFANLPWIDRRRGGDDE
jgi:hypothetical protein